MTDTTLAPTAAELLEAVASLRRALRRRVGRVGGVSELTDAQRELVRLVRREPGIRIGQAAGKLSVASNTVSTLAGVLVSAGWLVREADPADARSGRLTLSPAAEEAVAQWRDRRLSVLEEAITRLDGADRERLEAATPVLTRLVRDLEETP